MPKLAHAYKPLTADTWSAFQELFGSRGACGGCWCQSWRLTRAEFDAGKGAKNKSRMKKLAEGEVPPGILLFEDGQAVAWCSLAPREQFVRLLGSRVWKPVDEKPVWSISCFFVRKGFRNRGLSVSLLESAKHFAKKHGAKILEGYPQELKGNRLPDAFVWTGLTGSYTRAGFSEAARRSAAKPIMRFTMK